MNHDSPVYASPSSLPLSVIKCSRWAAAAALCLTLAGCETGVSPSALPVSWRTPPSGPVVLSEGDVVKLYFPGAPEFSSSQKIRADGKLSLTGLGEIQAAGKSLLRLQSEISSKYRSQIQNPTVVATLESSGTFISVMGGVMAPTKIAPDHNTTLLEALLAAGGVNVETGDARRVRIVRLSHGQAETVTVNMKAALMGTDNTPVYLKAGDNVTVAP